MSDIQRYSLNQLRRISYNERDDYNCNYIKEDDHIAEVEKWRNTALHQSELNGKLQARIAELENVVEAQNWTMEEFKKHHDKIKAEGIEEMLHKIDFENVADNTTLYYEGDILEYIDKLRGKA